MSNVSRQMRSAVAVRAWVKRQRMCCRGSTRSRAAGLRNARAWLSVLRRPAHHRACASRAAAPSRRAARPLAGSAPLGRGERSCFGAHRRASLGALGLAPALRVRSACAATVLAPRPASALRAHAGGCFGGGCSVASKAAAGKRNGQAVYENTGSLTANPSIERTSKRLRLFAAAHVER
jgi:hypothetical protein